MKTDGQATADAGGAQPVAPRRSTASEIAAAIDLGWRVAALHALRPTQLTPPSTVTDDMLLNRRSLSAPDRVELELRAIAGVASHVGVALAEARLLRLLTLAGGSGESTDAEQAFRNALARQHLAFAKQLWATDEPSGKAYELGNFLSDSWNRVLRPSTTSDPHSELHEIFGDVRVERMKVLLDDLQSRIDPAAVHAVNSHLDQWRDRVRDAPHEATPAEPDDVTVEQIATRFEAVERQTVIWRQMLTGAKEPEAFLDRAARAGVRNELSRQLWKRYRTMSAWLVPLLAVLAAAGLLLYFRNQDALQGAGSIIVAAAGALGVQRASVVGVARRGLDSWGELVYNRALAVVICRETLLVDELFPPSAKRAREGR